MDHEGVLGAEALTTFEALKLKLATALLVNLNNSAVKSPPTHTQWVQESYTFEKICRKVIEKITRIFVVFVVN